ncbi:MAG: peptidoglycan-binding protein [Paracoccaceae bacterium]|nr:MAG: peptidoglycan-binding protein [Paracoccaceae bacterium]
MAVLAEPNTSSQVVLEAQKLLNKASRQSRTPENGAFDKATVAAIKQFQIESGLRPTGVLDDKVMEVLRKASSGEPPKWQVTVNGKVYLLTESDHRALIERVKKEFRAPMIMLKGAVEEARMLFDDMKKLRSDQYIVGWCIDAVKGIRLPSESVIKNAEAAASSAQKMLDAGNLKAFAIVFPKAQTEANKARAEMKAYVSSIIDGGEKIVTGLEIVRDTSFVVVGVIAAPVAASYGLGAVAAGVVAGAGTAAVETIANEVGKGIAGQSKGIGDASLNVLKDAFIGGSIGALIKGGAADKILAKLGPEVAKRLGGEMFKKASEKVVVQWLINYFKANGKDILEGVMKETLKAYKSNAGGLTVEKFVQIVAKEVVTAGPFKKLEKLGDFAGKELVGALSSSTKKKLLQSLGEKATDKELAEVMGKVFGEASKEIAGKVYDQVLSGSSGSESPDALEKKALSAFATNAKLIKAVEDECEKRGKRKK